MNSINAIKKVNKYTGFQQYREPSTPIKLLDLYFKNLIFI